MAQHSQHTLRDLAIPFEAIVDFESVATRQGSRTQGCFSHLNTVGRSACHGN